MLVLVLLLSIFVLLGILAVVLYLRCIENSKLDLMALQNLLTEEEKRYYLTEYKKVITSKIVYELMSDNKHPLEVAREMVKNNREK